MKLDELTAAGVPGLRSLPPSVAPVEIDSLAYDSRDSKPGALFFCVPGHERDGHAFAQAAVAQGAVALVVERPLALGVPELVVESARVAMGPLAAHFYGDPTRELQVIGVTGTNGKTTTAHLVRALLEACGRRCGLLGTVHSIVAGAERPATRTTPEAVDLQADFRAMLDGGDACCAMEVSSHALALGRTGGTRFAAAVFTNLTQDHLDFHETMEDYFQAKRLLFAPPQPGQRPGLAVLGVDDPYGRRLADELPDAKTFAIDADADYRARELHIEPAGSRFQLLTPAGDRTVAIPLAGRFNVANALAAVATCHSLGCDLDVLVAALARGVRVPGRFEPVDEGQGFAVVVDYAHTPDSLQNVLATARELAESRHGRVLCVFGAGGDRDAGKRPLMGRAAARLADVAIVTSDNPRSEDPATIVAQIAAGAEQERDRGGRAELWTELDRRTAIERAVEYARGGDIVVIAGKGHEQGQEVAGGRKVPFDDVQVAREILSAKAA